MNRANRKIRGVFLNLWGSPVSVSFPPLPLPYLSFFFALVRTFATNSRGNACYAGYPAAGHCSISLHNRRYCYYIYYIGVTGGAQAGFGARAKSARHVRGGNGKTTNFLPRVSRTSRLRPQYIFNNACCAGYRTLELRAESTTTKKSDDRLTSLARNYIRWFEGYITSIPYA